MGDSARNADTEYPVEILNLRKELKDKNLLVEKEVAKNAEKEEAEEVAKLQVVKMEAEAAAGEYIKSRAKKPVEIKEAELGVNEVPEVVEGKADCDDSGTNSKLGIAAKPKKVWGYHGLTVRTLVLVMLIGRFGKTGGTVLDMNNGNTEHDGEALQICSEHSGAKLDYLHW